MPLSPGAARELVATYAPQWKKNRDEIQRLERWYRSDLDHVDKPDLPREYTREMRKLRDRSHTPWLGLVVTAVAQALYVEGYRRSNDENDAAGWDVWQANRMDARQVAINRGFLAHGQSFATCLDGKDPLSGEPMPQIRGVSARNMIALWDDEANDTWPMYALEGERTRFGNDPGTRFRMYDEEAVYTVDVTDGTADSPRFVTLEEHDGGVCPVVRFANTLDLEGRTTGEVGPFIPLAQRIDQDTFDRLVVQRFGAFVVRTISGMDRPEDLSEAEREKLRLRVEEILVSESTDTKFGSLPATPLDGFIKAGDSDVQSLAAVSQTPTDVLTGQLNNLSADAIAAARAGFYGKVEERKLVAGESYEQLLRFAQHLRGDRAGAADFAVQVKWADTQTRSLAQAADALGKLATMLGVPVQVLWEKIPGFTDTDVDRARSLYEQGGAFADLQQFLDDRSTNSQPGSGETTTPSGLILP